MRELFRKAPEADNGRARGSVELKLGVEKIDEGGRRDCEGWTGRGAGDGVAASDIVFVLSLTSLGHVKAMHWSANNDLSNR